MPAARGSTSPPSWPTRVCPSRRPACSAAPTPSPSSNCSPARASRTASCACPGRTRVNVKIVDEVLDQVTDINFPGLAPRACGPGHADRGHRGAVQPTPTGSCSPAACRPGVPTRVYADLVTTPEGAGQDRGAGRQRGALRRRRRLRSGHHQAQHRRARRAGRPAAPEPRRGHRRRPDPDRRRGRPGGRLHGGGRRPVRASGDAAVLAIPPAIDGQEHRGRRRRHGGRHRGRHPAGPGPGRVAPGSPPPSRSAPWARSDPTCPARPSSHRLCRARPSDARSTTTDFTGEHRWQDSLQSPPARRASPTA